MENLLKKYGTYFPDIPSLFDYQETVLELLSSKQNTLSIIPTGGGKSLIFQLMALELSGITIVVSPLLALMEEQVNELNNRGIKSLALNSNISFINQRKVLRNLKNENYKILYVAPERLQNPFFRASLISSGISTTMIVIDEAHCISQWGSSFRPDYGQINGFVQFLYENKINPFLYCLTATLSMKAREDIVREFSITAQNVFISQNMIRENLNLQFQKVENEKEKEIYLRKFLKRFMPNKTIVYLYSKKKCEEYAKLLADDHITNYFHAGRSPLEKKSVYDDFLEGRIEVMFATTAFGMGINIPDIDAVIHLQIPNSIEEYYQQVGRGWRKRTEERICNCLVLWSEVNFDRRAKEINGQKYSVSYLEQAYRALIGSAKVKRKGKIVNKNKEAFLNSDYNLQLLKYKLENHGILKTVGEINGSPLTIIMKTNTNLWTEIVAKSKSGIDSFKYVGNELNLKIEFIIDHLYQEDLRGNIEKIPAMEKEIFFELLTTELTDEVSKSIIDEINSELDFKIEQLKELKQLFLSKDPEKYLAAVLK